VVARPLKRAVRQLPYSDNMDFKLEWKLSNEPLPDIGFAISNTIIQVVNEQMPDLAEMFPFQRSWELQGHLDEAWMVAVITDAKASQVPSGQHVLGTRTQAFRPHSA
ncbi:MAG TPA: hypothetical protein VES69_10920, partial [Pyrinomonadaceae bacterium]|nr:hypothetical protein [Pyrinomonadaceae bacterium]